MKFGAYTSCMHDRSLSDAIDLMKPLGLTSLELNVGGFFPTPHIHVDQLVVSASAREEFLEGLAASGMELTALMVSGNPLHPDQRVGYRHAHDLRRAIVLAELLGVSTIVAQSGNPGGYAGSTMPSWVVSPWDSVYLDQLDYQWNDVAIPFWKDIDARAGTAGVRVAVEMHPHQLVYNPPTLTRLMESTGENIGCEMDPSHLFWQGVDPVLTIRSYGDRVFLAAAKDTKIHEENLRRNGFLNNNWRRSGPNGLSIGADYTVNDYPDDPSYEFVAVGNGHDLEFWAEWLRALHDVRPDIAVNIEHEDVNLTTLQGIQISRDTLFAAAELAGISR
jgi:sugar phosphate isomerase/epimerase